ncbi:MAG: helix-turn-helix transcriptional regulator [Eubacteriales bacterium]|nr:helix-turn-helix transcriptional regulator [Eubacteriales bacterium]
MNVTMILQRLFKSLLHTDVGILEEMPDYITLFEETHCYDKNIQPLFTKDALQLLSDSMKENVFYEITDKLGIHEILFRVHGSTYMIGPYVTLFFDESKIQTLLIKNGFPISHITPIRLRYTNYPYLQSTDCYHTIRACLVSFYEDLPEFTFRSLYGFENEGSPDSQHLSDAIDYSDIYRRYENENKLLNAITAGDVNNLKDIFSTMKNDSREYTERNYRSTSYRNPSSIMRALARKAAERGGLSVILIDELTQQQVQAENSNRKNGIPDDSLEQLILNLANAVAEQKRNSDGCTPAVIAVMDYIYYNYSQELTMEHLAKVSGYSIPHLSRMFRQDTGMTISDYIARTRLEKSAELLKTTKLTVQEIGFLVGYSDNNYFNKRFRKYFGQTPGKYRIENKNS